MDMGMAAITRCIYVLQRYKTLTASTSGYSPLGLGYWRKPAAFKSAFDADRFSA